MSAVQQSGICPLCGQPNDCAMATAKPGARVKECWCFSMPKLDKNVLEKLLQDRKQCICRSCWERVTAER